MTMSKKFIADCNIGDTVTIVDGLDVWYSDLINRRGTVSRKYQNTIAIVCSNDLYHVNRSAIVIVEGHGVCDALLFISKVIFNNPATIILWSDGTKTVVKVQDGEPYDPEKGMAMAISKKLLGNRGNYYNEFKKWLPDNENPLEKLNRSFDRLGKALSLFRHY